MEVKTVVTLVFLIYSILYPLIIFFRVRYHYLVNLLKVLLIISYVGFIIVYVLNAGYIESRVDAQFFISVSKAVVDGVNPYTNSLSSYYGPLYNLLIAPATLIPSGFKVVCYGVIALLILTLITYKLSKRTPLEDPSLITLLTVCNPVIHYYGIALAQIDDLLLSIAITLTSLIILYSEVLASITIPVASLIKPTGVLLLSTLLRKGRVKLLITSLLIVVVGNAVALSLYGYVYLYNVYLGHGSRVGGLSIASLIYILYGEIPVTPLSIASLVMPILIPPLILKHRDDYRIMITSLELFYILTPLNLPEYYLWLTPLLSIYALAQNNLRLCIALTLSITSGRLWQEFIQSSTTFNPYIHTTLTITYIIAQLLVLKELLIGRRKHT